MKCSQAALDLIWQEETGGSRYYNDTNECHADWPEGASGVTIGGFYDCGYVTRAELLADWGNRLPADMIKALEGVIGIKGRPAKSHARELDGIVTVPITVAREVFEQSEIPKWEAVVSQLPNADTLSGDSFGALVSLAMNRGNAFQKTGTRYREMRLIYLDMQDKYFSKIPPWFLSMRRLWPKDGDLYKRREHEAALFEQGLKES